MTLFGNLLGTRKQSKDTRRVHATEESQDGIQEPPSTCPAKHIEYLYDHPSGDKEVVCVWGQLMTTAVAVMVRMLVTTSWRRCMATMLVTMHDGDAWRRCW